MLRKDGNLISSYETTRYSAVTMQKENVCEFTIQLIDVKKFHAVFNDDDDEN